jgi:hypothetical protein
MPRLPADTFELAPGHVLRRATADEIAVIRETAVNLLPGPHQIYRNLWEIRWPVAGPHELLPEDEWRYFVIAFTGHNDTINDLQLAFDLSLVELEIAFTIVDTDLGGVPGWGTISNAGRNFQVFHDAPFRPEALFGDVRTEDLQATRDICDRMQRHQRAALVDVAQFARQLGDLKSLPQTSPLRFLGYFAILEALLTHLPNPADPYESITRQVRSKVALLDNRWTPRLDYRPFGKHKPDKVWTKMYAYRSILAHGGKPDFKNELAMLGNPEQALSLIKETVKAALRFALIEPQLMVDLQNC